MKTCRLDIRLAVNSPGVFNTNSLIWASKIDFLFFINAKMISENYWQKVGTLTLIPADKTLSVYVRRCVAAVNVWQTFLLLSIYIKANRFTLKTIKLFCSKRIRIFLICVTSHIMSAITRTRVFFRCAQVVL